MVQEIIQIPLLIDSVPHIHPLIPDLANAASLSQAVKITLVTIINALF